MAHGDDIEDTEDKKFLELLREELENQLVLCYEPILNTKTGTNEYCPLPENIIIKDVLSIVEDTILKWQAMRDHERGKTPL